MSLNDELLKAMDRYVSREVGFEVSVYSYSSETIQSGYCDTCYFEEDTIDMYYRAVGDEHADSRMYSYSGGLGEFIRVLSDG